MYGNTTGKYDRVRLVKFAKQFNDPQEQTLILKWIPPTYVNFNPEDELPAVEHTVK